MVKRRRARVIPNSRVHNGKKYSPTSLSVTPVGWTIGLIKFRTAIGDKPHSFEFHTKGMESIEVSITEPA